MRACRAESLLRRCACAMLTCLSDGSIKSPRCLSQHCCSIQIQRMHRELCPMSASDVLSSRRDAGCTSRAWPQITANMNMVTAQVYVEE